jgi:hypothetical protein
MTTKDRGTLVTLTDISTEVAPDMKEVASVSAIGPRRRNEPELTGFTPSSGRVQSAPQTC